MLESKLFACVRTGFGTSAAAIVYLVGLASGAAGCRIHISIIAKSVEIGGIARDCIVRSETSACLGSTNVTCTYLILNGLLDSDDGGERQSTQVFQEDVRRVGEQVVTRGDSCVDGDAADAIPLGGDDIARRVAHQRDGCAFGDPALRACVADGEAGQTGAVLGHFAERSEAEIGLEAGAVKLLPSDACEVAGDQPEQRAALLQAAQEMAGAWAGFTLQVRDAAHVDLLRAADDLGHGAANGGLGCTSVAQHAGEDVGVEHAVDGDIVRRGFDACHAADGIDESLAVVRAGAADERAVDVEEDQGGRGMAQAAEDSCCSLLATTLRKLLRFLRALYQKGAPKLRNNAVKRIPSMFRQPSNLNQGYGVGISCRPALVRPSSIATACRRSTPITICW